MPRLRSVPEHLYPPHRLPSQRLIRLLCRPIGAILPL
jgi:hypothetical protein